jgi:CubicO group peptidase (beta-lactamase class C family)
LTAVLFVAAPTPLAAQAKPDWAAFDKYVAKAAAEWRVPALAIAVVKDDSVVFAKGYGVLQKGSSQPANEHTRFAIGSTTKAMTSASIAMLVDEGKLKLDDPSRSTSPSFSCPIRGSRASSRSVTCSRIGSGLPGTDLFWASNWKYSQADFIRGLRYIQPTASFRSEWQYHNVLYALNGLIIERVSGMPWEQFVKKRIFEPLGMNETLALVSMIAGQPNVAVPHALVNDSVTVVRSAPPTRSRRLEASGRASRIWPSGCVRDRQRARRQQAPDSAAYLRRVGHAADSGADGRVPGAAAREARLLQLRAGMVHPGLSRQQVWMHTGSINGLCAIIGIEPNKRLGVYVLENLDHAEIRHGLMYSAFDLFENGPRRDWSVDLKPIFARPRGDRGAGRACDVGSVAPARALRRDVRRLGLWQRARHSSRTARCRPRSSPIPPCRSSR